MAFCTVLPDFPNLSPDIHIFSMIVPLQENLAMIIMGGLSKQMVVLASLMVKPLLDEV